MPDEYKSFDKYIPITESFYCNCTAPMPDNTGDGHCNTCGKKIVSSRSANIFQPEHSTNP